MVTLTASIRSDTPSDEPDHEYADDAPTRILLLVNVQRAMLDPRLGNSVPAAETVKANIKEILRTARKAAHPPLIIHVRNKGDAGEPDEENQPGWELVFDPLPGEPVIDKVKDNAFTDKELSGLVSPDAQVVIIGMQSDFCVQATCAAALSRENMVLLIHGAHAAHDRLEVWENKAITPASSVEKGVEQKLEKAGVLVLDMSDVPSIWEDR